MGSSVGIPLLVSTYIGLSNQFPAMCDVPINEVVAFLNAIVNIVGIGETQSTSF